MNAQNLVEGELFIWKDQYYSLHEMVDKTVLVQDMDQKHVIEYLVLKVNYHLQILQ